MYKSLVKFPVKIPIKFVVGLDSVEEAGTRWVLVGGFNEACDAHPDPN
jgi:hypothetical protein